MAKRVWTDTYNLEVGMVCKNCGEYLEGDGYRMALHCPNADEAEYEYNAPDADPVYCTMHNQWDES